VSTECDLKSVFQPLLFAACDFCGFKGSRGMQYNPLTKRYWLSGDTSVNYMVACRRPG
jgi:2-polyprenyl-3-methyl-5-hydroxy-6-metoxy-1,4-benzoquinol methylase